MINKHSLGRLITLLVLTSLILSGCIFDPRLKRAESILSDSVAELPDPIEMDFIGDVPVQAYPSVIDSSDCIYAEYFRAYGTEISSEQALDQYGQQLKAQGWQEASQSTNSRFLIRGPGEAIDLATYPMGWYASELDPDNRRAEFPTVLHLSLSIKLPQREGC